MTHDELKALALKCAERVADDVPAGAYFAVLIADEGLATASNLTDEQLGRLLKATFCPGCGAREPKHGLGDPNGAFVLACEKCSRTIFEFELARALVGLGNPPGEPST